MKLGAKEKNLIIGLIGVVIAVVVWMFVASPLKDKKDALVSENASLKVTKDEYEAVNAQRKKYEEGITSLTDEREELLEAFPAGMAREDEIMYWANMERDNMGQLGLLAISMSSLEEVFVDEYKGSSGEGATQLHLYKAPVHYVYLSTYEGLKSMVKYVFAQDDKKSIEGLKVDFDATTGNLEGYIDINMYYMVGTGNEVEPVVIPQPATGVSNVFRAANEEIVKEGEAAETESTEAEEE